MEPFEPGDSARIISMLETPEERPEWEGEYERAQRDAARRVAELESLGKAPEERERYYAQRVAQLERLSGLVPS